MYTSNEQPKMKLPGTAPLTGRTAHLQRPLAASPQQGLPSLHLHVCMYAVHVSELADGSADTGTTDVMQIR